MEKAQYIPFLRTSVIGLIVKNRKFIAGFLTASVIFSLLLYKFNLESDKSLQQQAVLIDIYEQKANESLAMYQAKSKLANSLFKQLESSKKELRQSHEINTKAIDENEKANIKLIEAIDTNHVRDSAFIILNRFTRSVND